MSSEFSYAWLCVLWVFQGIGFARAYMTAKAGESLGARNVALVIHIITLLALMNVKV
jgi:hypothetical protein